MKFDEFDKVQLEINKKNDAFNESLDDNHKKKIKAIGEALALFKEVGLPVEIFAYHEHHSSKGKKVAVMYNNIRDLNLSTEDRCSFYKELARSVFFWCIGFIERVLYRFGRVIPVDKRWLLINYYFEYYADLDVTSELSIEESELRFINRVTKIDTPNTDSQ